MERTKSKRIGGPGDVETVARRLDAPPSTPLPVEHTRVAPVQSTMGSKLGERATAQAAGGAASATTAASSTTARTPALSLNWRLRKLRDQVQADCRRATAMTSFLSTGLWVFLAAGWLLGLEGVGELLLSVLQGRQTDLILPDYLNIVLLIVVALLAPVLIAHVGYTMLASRRLANWAYVDCLRGLTHQAYGLLFTDERLQQALNEIQGEHWTETLLPEAHSTQLERFLEQASENFPAARLLPGGTEAAIRKQLLSRRWRQRRHFYFRLPNWVWLACIAVPPLGIPFLAAGASTYVFLGPRYIVSRAQLLAFLDHCLETPRGDVAKLGPPTEPRTWRERLLAPWTTPLDLKLW